MRYFHGPCLHTIALCLAYTTALTQTELPPLPLPSGVTSSYVDTTNTSGLVFHYLSSGCSSSNTTKPLILILHGFPEIAYGFKDLLVPIAEQGYCVVAPDQRGYGRTTGWDTRTWAYVDLEQWKFENLVRDLVAFVYAIGYKEPRHLQICNPHVRPLRPTLPTPLQPPLTTLPPPPQNLSVADWAYSDLEYALEHLNPPRKQYQWSNSQTSAAVEYLSSPAIGGLPNFFRINWFVKSYDYLKQFPVPHKLASADVSALAEVPLFYIMLANQTVSETLATLNYGQNASISKDWFPDSDVQVYVQEFERTGFQGALNYYRILTSPPGPITNDGLLWAGRRIEVPTFFLGGKWDWQTWLVYGALENYNKTSADYRGGVLLNESGHWPYIEQPRETVAEINKFLASL